MTMSEVAIMEEHSNRMRATTDLLLEIQKTLVLLNDLIQQLVTPILIYKSEEVSSALSTTLKPSWTEQEKVEVQKAVETYIHIGIPLTQEELKAINIMRETCKQALLGR